MVDWLKLNGGTTIANAVMTYGGKYLATLVGGFWGKIIQLAFKHVIIPFIKKFKKHLVIDSEAKQEIVKFEEVINKPGVTHEEFTAAGDDFYNRP